MARENRVKTTVTSKTASVRSVIAGDDQQATVRATGPKLTEKEWQARRIKKYATTTSGFIGGFGNRTADGNAYSSGGAFQSQFGNFYSPQLSTDFLEKPQNLRERRAWYRHFYASNEFVRQAIDLHTKLPLSKIRLEKPKCENYFGIVNLKAEPAKIIRNVIEDIQFLCNKNKLNVELDDIVKIKLTEIRSQLPNYLKGSIVSDRHILVMMRYYELLKELKKTHGETK